MARAISVHNRLPETETFHRTLTEDGSKIISRCAECGEVIVASVSEGLPRREVEHFLACSKRRIARPAAA